MSEKNKKQSWNNFKKPTYSSAKSAAPSRIDFMNLTKDWSLYFSEHIYKNDTTIERKVKIVEDFLHCSSNDDFYLEVDRTMFFKIDINKIIKNDEFFHEWQNFKNDLENSPEYVINIFGLAMERLIRRSNVREYNTINLKRIIPRFCGLKNLLPYQELKGHNYGKLVTIIGVVVRSGGEKPLLTDMAFMCPKCKTEQLCRQEKGYFNPPDKCINSDCHSKIFEPLLNSPLTKTTPWKMICLQELSDNQSEDGRVPRVIECKLTSDLTNFCIPGDVVVITGIVEADVNEESNIAGNDRSTYSLYISANSVTCLKEKTIKCTEVSDSLDFKTEDLEEIEKIRSEKNLFELLVASLCPNIYGHEMIKAGIILSLFSASCYSESNSVRKNSHILIVGDPGLGKSQMLLATTAVSPRGVYVCGNSTTSTGLTVTLIRDGDNSLEAGALVLADQGHCCIDEFDKMMNQHSALLEAMEQQTVSIAKSGVICTLPARASVVAAANPASGHYDRSKTVSENLRIRGSILSRFDLVFIIKDSANQEIDNKVSEHVMALHNRKDSSTTSKYFSGSSQHSVFESVNRENSLERKLQVFSNGHRNLIPHKQLQMYISYTRKFSQPKMPLKVSSILQSFYLEMRRLRNLNFNCPVTTRQLESLVRLTQARARVDLRQQCIVQDAEEAIEIMKFSMEDTFSDEYGNIDFERSIHGSGMSKGSQARKVISALTKAAKSKNNCFFSTQELKDIALKSNIDTESFTQLLETLNDQGFLLKTGFQTYKLQSI